MTNQEKEMNKTYVIFHDEYMGSGTNAYEFEGTYYELLRHVNNLEDDMDDEFMLFRELPTDRSDLILDDPRYYKLVKDFTNEDLTFLFNLLNGDGQPYYVVWDIADHKKVLG